MFQDILHRENSSQRAPHPTSTPTPGSVLDPRVCPTPSLGGSANSFCSAELLQRYQHMVNLPSVQKFRVICPNGDFCIFILMSVFKAYETGNCREMSISNIYRLQLFLYGVWFDCRIFYFNGSCRLCLLCVSSVPTEINKSRKKGERGENQRSVAF